MSNIDLCVFISSKDRYGRYNDYKITIDHLFNNSADQIFNKKFLSLKVFENDEQNVKNIMDFFSQYDFEIFIIRDSNNIQDNDRYANRQKFIGGIADDISTFFIQNSDKLSKYVFVLEDDSPVIIKQNDLDFYVQKSIIELESNPNLEGIHFLRLSYNEIPIKPTDWFVKHQVGIPDFSEVIYKGKYWYSFQPRVNKTDHILEICRIIKQNWHDYFRFLHPEDAFDKAYQIHNPNTEIYAFSPLFAYSIHLGAEPEYYQDIVNSESDILKIYNSINDENKYVH